MSQGQFLNLNEAVDDLEFQWQSMKKQHGNFDQRSASNSPQKNYLLNSLKLKDSSLIFDMQHVDLTGRNTKTISSFLNTPLRNVPNILKKVVPLSKINLAQMVNQIDQNNQVENRSMDSYDSKRLSKGNQDLKESDHFKAIVDKYSNINRKRNPDTFYNRNVSINDNKHESPSQKSNLLYQSVAGNGGASPALQKQGICKNYPKKETYNKNNLKMIDENVKCLSKENSPFKGQYDLKKSKTQNLKTEKPIESRSRVSIKLNQQQQEHNQQYPYNNQYAVQQNQDLYQSQFSYGTLIARTQEEQFQPLQPNHYPVQNQLKVKPEYDQYQSSSGFIKRKIIVQCNLACPQKRLTSVSNKYLISRTQSKENQNPIQINTLNEDRQLKRYSTLHQNNVDNRAIELKIKKK